MADFKSVDALLKSLQSRIEKVIQEKVPEVVEEEMIRQIDRVVYDAYPNPKYKRTYQLQHPDSIQTVNVPGGVKITNVRTDGDHMNDEGTGKYVAHVVESGQGYDYPYPGMKPRPFTEETRKELKQTGKHIYAVRKGLKEQGLRVE